MKMPTIFTAGKAAKEGRGKAHRFWYRFCTVCLALYLAYVVFLTNSNLFVSTANTLGALVMFALCAAGFYGLLLFVSKLPLRLQKGKERKWLWLWCLCISAVVLGSVFSKSYPGGVSYDAANQWWQAHSGEYNNWHPVFHTLLIRLCTLACDRYPFVVFVQCVAFALAAAYLTATVHRMGVPAWLALAAHLLVHLTPLVRNTLMYVWKDNAMTIGVMVLTAQSLSMLNSRGEWLRKWRNAVCFGLVLAFTTLVRHNAILFTLPLLVIVLLSWGNARRMAALAAAVMAACVLLVRGPVYGALDVVYPENTVEEAVGLPMTLLGNAMQQNPAALDEETRTFLLTLADEEAWRSVYRRNDYNAIKFTYPRELIAQQEPLTLLGMAGRTALRDPRLAFETFTGVTGLVMDISGEDRGVVTVSNSGHLPEESIGQPFFNDLGSRICTVLDAPMQLLPLRWLTRNIGVAQLLLLLGVLVALWRKGPQVLALGFPTLIYDLATMLLLCGNDARFFQFVPAIALPVALALCWQSVNVTE